MLSEREQGSIRSQSLDHLLEWHLRHRGTPNSVDDLLDMVIAAHAESVAADEALQRWVVAARRYGATWQQIGNALGASRQAAQKRFGDHLPPTPLSADGRPGYRVAHGVEIGDELAVLSQNGGDGYVLVEVGAGTMTFVESPSKVAHRRVPLLARGPTVDEYRADGWEVVAQLFPFTYLARSEVRSERSNQSS